MRRSGEQGVYVHDVGISKLHTGNTPKYCTASFRAIFLPGLWTDRSQGM